MNGQFGNGQRTIMHYVMKGFAAVQGVSSLGVFFEFDILGA